MHRHTTPSATVSKPADSSSLQSSTRNGYDGDDDALLEQIGYQPSFKREFTSLSTISFAFSVMGLCSSVATTFNTPLFAGGPASVTWCWILGSFMCLTLGASVAEIVSAFPTCGGIYTASANLCPAHLRPVVGWIIGWLSVLAQLVGLSSSEYGLANMIWSAVVIAKDGAYEVTAGKSVGLCVALLVVHGALNSLATRQLARFTTGFVFVNLGTTLVIIVALLALTPRNEMHSASVVFGAEGLIDGAPGWDGGVSFLFGLLSVQWTMTGYDATAHISEEVRRASYLAPSAIFIAVIGTGLIGWVLNIVLVLCSGPYATSGDASSSAFLQILALRLGKPGALVVWAAVCTTAFCVCQTGLHAGSRTLFAFSRDHGLPDRGLFGTVSGRTRTPLAAIWGLALGSAAPALLALASPAASDAVFAMTAMAFDLSYVVPIVLRRAYTGHPGVRFRPGPFYMGDGWFGWTVNVACVLWTLFVCAVFSLPTARPVTGANMNYAAVRLAFARLVATCSHARSRGSPSPGASCFCRLCGFSWGVAATTTARPRLSTSTTTPHEPPRMSKVTTSARKRRRDRPAKPRLIAPSVSSAKSGIAPRG